MSDKNDSFDRYGPFLTADCDPPGRWMPGEHGLQQWEGRNQWRTQHGDAVVAWLCGRPIRVWNARFGEARVDAENLLDFGWRRSTTGAYDWVYGDVQIRPGEVLFADGQQPDYSPPFVDDEPDLEVDLAEDGLFRADLQDARFAAAAYLSLANRQFFKINPGKWWICGERQAARLVAYMRRRGDSYKDYFPHCELKGHPPEDRPRMAVATDNLLDILVVRQVEAGSALATELPHFLKTYKETRIIDIPPSHLLYSFLVADKARWDEVSANADVFDRVNAHINRLGWRRENEAERRVQELQSKRRALDRRLELLKRVRECEERPAAETPDWAKPPLCARFIRANIEGLEELSAEEREAAQGELAGRIYALAETGRITKEELVVLRNMLS